jgi:ATP-dependent helicase/nuclease subunit A
LTQDLRIESIKASSRGRSSGVLETSLTTAKILPAAATDAESRRVIREELVTNLLVEAGAGSGKTQMLAERMATGIASGAYQIEHLAAVTFTRKAASELRGRFHLALEKELSFCRAGSSDPADRARLKRIHGALANLERFFAGTIHSFCARLLRERPVESGVSPGFTELDEVQEIELRDRAWRDFSASLRAAGDAGMMALLDTGVRPTDLKHAFATICLHDDVVFPPGDAECPDAKRALKALEKFWKQLQKELPSEIPGGTTCPIQNAAREFVGEYKVSRYRLDRPAVIASLLAKWNCKSKIVQTWWADTTRAKQRFRDLINPMHQAFRDETVTPYLSQWRQYVYRLSVSVLVRAREHAAAERRRVNSLNYGDLLTLTARVLRENAEVRRAMQRKYRHLFVDEFQDTDPVQAEIVFLLAANEPQSNVGPGLQTRPKASVAPNSSTTSQSARMRTADREPRTADWRSVPLRPGALFVVGDPKQSIYRFRRADIEIYSLVRDRFSEPATGRVLTLTRNFRSVSALCEFANQVFETRFPVEPTPHSPRFARLEPNPEASRRAGSSASAKAPADTSDPADQAVFTLTHACEKSGEVLTEDAAKIARFIRTEVDAGRRKYSDFLILTRKKRGRIAPYADALESLNVPLEVSGAGAFGESVEVETLTTLLRALADPQDAVALIAVLRGPLFGISDRELFAYKQSGGWFSLYAGRGVKLKAEDSVSEDPLAEGTPAGAEVKDRVTAALASLNQYHRWTRLLPASAALERILEHTGYLALAATTPGGVEAGDLLHAIDRVRHVVEDGGSLSDAADMLEDDSDESSEVESLPLEPGKSDVVRIMNLHKAKGLEADVVFLADPCGGFDPRVDVHIARTGNQPEGWFQVTRKSETSYKSVVLGEHKDWAVHQETEKPFLDAEQDRLLYVAATRARKQLVVSRWTTTPRNGAWTALDPFLGNARELPVASTVNAAVTPVQDSSVAAQSEANTALDAGHDRVKQPSWSITSATAEARHVARISRADDVAADDPTRVVRKDTPTHRADAGMAWGTLIHGLLEHAMRFPNSTPDDLRRLAMWLTVEEPQLRAVLDDAIETVQRVAKAEFWAAAQAGEHYEEAPFAFADDRAMTSGVIDLLFGSAGAWRVRDYKTDSALNASNYQHQLDVYQKALQALGSAKPEAVLVPVSKES